jgi:PAS domain S-box-containing protein
MPDPRRSASTSHLKRALGLSAAVILTALLATLALRAGIDGLPMEQALALQVTGPADAVLIGAAAILILGLTLRQLWLADDSAAPALLGLAHPPLLFTLTLSLWAAALPLLAIFLVGLHHGEEERRATRLRTAEEAVRLTVHRIDARLENGLALLANLAALPRLRTSTPAGCDPLAGELVRAFPPFSGLDSRDAEGRVVCQARGRPALRIDAKYLARLAAGQPFVYTAADSERRAVLVQPLRSEDGAVVGALDLDLDIDLLAAMAASGMGPGQQLALVQRDGAVLAMPREASGFFHDKKLTRQMQNPALTHWEEAGRVYAAAPLARIDWRVLLVSEELAVRRTVYDLPWLLPALALSYLLAYALHRGFARPWLSTADTLARLARGEAGARMPVQGSSEAARAALALNHFAAERETAEGRLSNQAEHCRQALFLIADWYWVVDPSLRIARVDFGDGAAPELRHRIAALKGRLLWELDPARSARPDMQQLRASLQDRQAFRELAVTLAPSAPPGDGSDRPMDTLWNGEPLHDRNGAFLGYHGVGRDVTRLLRQTEASRRFETALAQASDPVLLLERDPAGGANRIFFANRAAALLFDYPEASLLGRPLESLVAVDDGAGSEDLAQALASGIPLHRRVRMQRRKGSTQTIDLRVDLLLDGRGEQRSFIAIMRDLTADIDRTRQVVQAHEELKQAMRQRSHELEVMAKELESFSYTVSHDLRAPLRVVEGFARILVEDYGRMLDKMAHDHLQRIITAAARMNSMINALLDLSRLSSQPIVREPLSLSRMAEEVIEDLRSQETERTVSVRIAPDVVTEGDRTLLRIVLDNLIGNAWKYSGKHPHPEIEFGLRHQGSTPVYFVQDNGAGFDMRFADRLFGVFQRLHSAADFPGTGVGLATVQRIVRRHGGRIWAESEPGGGSVFFFTLWERAALNE